MVTFIRTFLVGIHMAFVEMGKHRLRSFLSILGVMLGMTALVAMLCLIGGIDVFLKEKIGRWSGALWIWQSRDPPEEEKLSWSRSPGLRLSDGTYLENTSPDVAEVFQRIEWRGTVHLAGARHYHVRVQGTTEATFNEDTNTIRLDVGRFLTPEDYRKGNRVCVVSWELYDATKERLRRQNRDSTDILAMDIGYKSERFRVVGTFVPKDEDFKPWGLRRSVMIPLLAMQKYISGFDPNPGSINLVVSDPDRLEALSTRIARVLTGRHRGVTDFEYRSAEWVENMRTMMSNVSMVMGIISGVSLLVGGLGIMNVMLSSISERIKEIGVRKALGAQNLQIFVQFIAETTTLSFTGGVIGACLGLTPLVFGDAIKKSTQGAIDPTILPLHVVYIFVVIVSVGVVFGLYPAAKASRMNPIDALRYE